jgi:hypothetical protein
MLNMKRIGIAIVLVALIGSVVPFEFVLAAPHDSGTNIVSNGTVYMIVNGQRRAYTSEGAFLSYGFNSWGTVVPANSEDLALNEGSFIPPRDGKIVCSDRGTDKGTCYLISNGKRSAFVSETVFKQLGFSFSKALYGDVSFLEKDSDISNSADQHRPGVLINRNGTIYLISPNGLMGIPNPQVLSTWGYTFADAIPANAKDALIAEYSVIANRQGGQLKPSDADPLNSATEEVIYNTYINAHPNLPSQEVTSQEDVALILNLNNQTESVDSLAGLYPYLTQKSIQFLDRLPTFREFLELDWHGLYDSQPTSTTVKVFEGKQVALLKETVGQQLTGYSHEQEMVLVKENGVWKFDFIGSLKRVEQQNLAENPSKAYVLGSGTSDIGIIGMEYDTAEVTLNDHNARFLVRIGNFGNTTIHKFIVHLRINNTDVYLNQVGYKIPPGQELILSIPINGYWNPNIIRPPGSYRTDLAVGFDPVSLDSDSSDNNYYINTNFK